MLPWRSSRTSGNSRATISGVRSGLPLSTTAIRIAALVGGCSRSEARQRRSSASAPWLTITTSRSGGGLMAAALGGAVAADDGARGAQEDRQVAGDREVVEVVALHRQPLLEGEVAAAVDLHRPGQAGLDREPGTLALVIEGDHGLLLGPRPDQRHVPLEHVDQLRQLVEAGPPQELSGPGDSRVVDDLEGRLVELLEVDQFRQALLGV